jgi:hypothetical protein
MNFIKALNRAYESEVDVVPARLQVNKLLCSLVVQFQSLQLIFCFVPEQIGEFAKGRRG